MNTLSLLERFHPLVTLKPLAALGGMAAVWMLVLGMAVALSARRSPKTGAWVGFTGLLALAFLGKVMPEGDGSFWLLAAILGSWWLLWVLLTPLYLRWSAWFAPVLWGLAALTLLFDATQVVVWQVIQWIPSAQAASPWMGPAQSMWQGLLLAAMLFVLLRRGALVSEWFRQLVLAHFGGSLAVVGFYTLQGRLAPMAHKAPILYITALAAAVWASYVVVQRQREAEAPELLERYRPHAGVAATHVFLILFTIATLYPVLWVVRMALTPTQSFTLDVNPMPKPLQHWFHAWRKGDRKAATCYRRAMAQNFREVMGQGSACYDQICGAWRRTKDPRLLHHSRSICTPFARIWERPPAFKVPARLAGKPKAAEEWKARKLQRWRKAQIDTWKQAVLARFPAPAMQKELKPLLKEIAYQQKERAEQGGLFWRQVLNSILVALATTLLGLFLACTAAYAFSRFRFPGRRLGLMSFLISQMFPGTLMMIPLYILIGKLGLLNSLVGLTLVYSTTSIPFCVWMLKGYFDTIPKELEEAALIDGASRTLIFWKIMLPLARPAIAVTALFSFMTAWNEFILAITFMNDKNSFTLPVMLQQFVGSHNTEWGHFAAGAILVSLPIVLLFFLLQKNLVGGLTAGSVKG